MKRLLTAGVAALVLVASQAAAVAPAASNLNPSDRAASHAQTANEFGNMSPLMLALIIAAIIAAIAALSQNDSPSSP